MYIQRYRKTTLGKVYESVYLTRSFRENGKVKHEHLANLSKVPSELILSMERELKGQKSFTLEDLCPEQGKAFGGLFAIKHLCGQTGVAQALGDSREGHLAMLQIMGRILCQGSRLYIAGQWSKDQAVEELLGVNIPSEDCLYENLKWLSKNQQQIEDQLFKIRSKHGRIENIYLYDVTSTYFEGQENEYAEFGYNRDKKKGKKQMVVGLLCDQYGYPVSIEVFRGNTSDTTTVGSQLQKLKNRFGIKNVIFVGDRGMVKSGSIAEMTSERWHYITAITKAQIQSLLDQGSIQMELFTDQLVEVELAQDNEIIRYVLHRNPVRAQEIENSRNDRIEKIRQYVIKKNTYLEEHPKAKIACALREINAKIAKLGLSQMMALEVSARVLTVSLDQYQLKQAALLDGCYVIKSNVDKDQASKETLHDRYKSLAEVEWAFRTMKQSFEEIRPVYVRKQPQTRGHVLVCMLAYMIVKTAWDACKDTGVEQRAIFETLDRIQFTQYDVKGIKVKVLPKIFTDRQQCIIDKLNLKFPSYV